MLGLCQCTRWANAASSAARLNVRDNKTCPLADRLVCYTLYDDPNQAQREGAEVLCCDEFREIRRSSNLHGAPDRPLIYEKEGRAASRIQASMYETVSPVFVLPAAPEDVERMRDQAHAAIAGDPDYASIAHHQYLDLVGTVFKAIGLTPPRRLKHYEH